QERGVRVDSARQHDGTRRVVGEIDGPDKSLTYTRDPIEAVDVRERGTRRTLGPCWTHQAKFAGIYRHRPRPALSSPRASVDMPRSAPDFVGCEGRDACAGLSASARRWR